MDFEELQITPKITTAKITQFKNAGINSVNDLVRIYPKRYIDYRIPTTVSMAQNGQKCAMKLEVRDVVRKMGQNTGYVTAYCREVTEYTPVKVIWFNEYIYDKVYSFLDKEVMVAGVFTNNQYGIQITNPDVITDDINEAFRIYPIYKKIPKMGEDYFNRVMKASLEQFNEKDSLSEDIIQKFNLLTEKELINCLHKPKDIEDIKKANKRLVFEALYPFCRKLIKDAETIQKLSRFKPYKLTKCNELIQLLPYELTDDQKAIVKKFMEDAQAGKRVNALVQGDVGSGKTIIAFLLMVAMSDNGYQSVLMAPTGILAKQHFEELRSYVEPMGLTAVYLSGDLKAKEKREVLKMIEDGTANFVVGTHSVISDSVKFKNLGLTVVDEEHKFGVVQRENLKNKADIGVHNISMSATPIPRSLAITLYGDAVDIYTIKSMPKGRLPIKTAVVNNYRSMFTFMEKEIREGHQAYMVCPLIEGTDLDSDEEKPISVNEAYRLARDYFEPRNINVEVITGKMKDEEKTEKIKAFKDNKAQVLIATTIIEVGTNVPNATVIAIMNAERFGLAGLHQLRGRVGRNKLQSYCMLVSTQQNNPRLEVMCETTNGFEIAEADLKLRGTGDFLGTRQSGEDKNVMLMLKYPKFYQAIKDYIKTGGN